MKKIMVTISSSEGGAFQQEVVAPHAIKAVKMVTDQIIRNGYMVPGDASIETEVVGQIGGDDGVITDDVVRHMERVFKMKGLT